MGDHFPGPVVPHYTLFAGRIFGVLWGVVAEVSQGGILAQCPLEKCSEGRPDAVAAATIRAEFGPVIPVVSHRPPLHLLHQTVQLPSRRLISTSLSFRKLMTSAESPKVPHSRVRRSTDPGGGAHNNLANIVPPSRPHPLLLINPLSRHCLTFAVHIAVPTVWARIRCRIRTFPANARVNDSRWHVLHILHVSTLPHRWRPDPDPLLIKHGISRFSFSSGL